MQHSIPLQKIGIYDVLYESDYKSKDGHKLYHIRCSKCGFETDRQFRHIDNTERCTHVNKAGVKKSYCAYKWDNKRIGRIFRFMIERCYAKNRKDYRWYGEKRIRICNEWLNNPKSFEDWAVNNGYADNLTIDRIDSNKDYCPDNCRWVTIEQNAKYKSTTTSLTVNTETHTGRDWANICHLGCNTINAMLRKYGVDITTRFIQARLTDMTKHRKSHQTWIDVYGIV